MTKHQLFKFVPVIIVILSLVLVPMISLAEDGGSTGTGTLTTQPPETGDTTETKIPDTPDIKTIVKPDQDASDSALAEYENTKGETDSKRLTALNNFGDKAIEARQKALTNLSTLLTKGKCANIDPTVKAVLQADIDKAIANLKTQQTTIDSVKLLTTEKSDIVKIFTNNRTFVNLVPAIKGACSAERIIELTSSTKITTIISALTAGSVDTTQLSTDLTAAGNDAKLALALFEKVAANPGDTNTTAKADLQAAMADMVKAKQSLAAAKNDLEVALEALDKTTTTDTTTGSDNSALNSGNSTH